VESREPGEMLNKNRLSPEEEAENAEVEVLARLVGLGTVMDPRWADALLLASI
jgi:hypothetical protein